MNVRFKPHTEKNIKSWRKCHPKKVPDTLSFLQNRKNKSKKKINMERIEMLGGEEH